ncbi:MAG: excisionase family DNA-binding protein [Thermomicrobiales bacterium]
MRESAAANEIVYTMAEASRVKGVSYHTVSRAVRKGMLDHTRMGRQVLIPESVLAAWRPMVERRPKKYAAREPEPGVQPTILRAGNAAGMAAGRTLERLVPALVGLGEGALSAESLREIVTALAGLLGCRDAAVIEWLPGNEGFVVRSAVGGNQDWLSFQDAGPNVITRPIRIGGAPVGLFVGVPEADRTPMDAGDRDLAVALLTLAGVAIVWGRQA